MATWRMISHLPPRRPFSRLSLSCRSSRGIVPARSGKTLIISYCGFYLALILCCVPPLLLFSLGFKTILFIYSYRPLHRKYTYSTDERTKRVVPTARSYSAKRVDWCSEGPLHPATLQRFLERGYKWLCLPGCPVKREPVKRATVKRVR